MCSNLLEKISKEERESESGGMGTRQRQVQSPQGQCGRHGPGIAQSLEPEGSRSIERKRREGSTGIWACDYFVWKGVKKVGVS